MVFSSAIFIFGFLPILLILYALSSKINLKSSNIVLLIFSLIFILWGSGKDILIMLTIIIINFVSGYLMTFGKKNKLLSKDKKRTAFQKTILIMCLTLSFGVLFYFKYMMFFNFNIQNIASKFGFEYNIPSFMQNILLPLGISFYTFQALSYTLDVYFGKVESTNKFLNFALYVSFFPQLIAGPIVRYSDIYAQIESRSIDVDMIYDGMMRFISGFIKKVLLANTVALAADGIFDLPIADIHFSIAWIGVIAYALQIYLDFSAYSDMAIGLAKIFGFNLLENFNLPYTSDSVQDFWRRWHISLSSWFRDYLYIPLGGNRKGNLRTYLNLVIVFFLCGLWHGANWTFLLWGLWHGLFLVLERLFIGKTLKKTPAFFGHVYTLLVVLLGWVMFRSDNIGFCMQYIKSLFSPFAEFSGEIFRIPAEFAQSNVIIAMFVSVFVCIGTFKKIDEIVKSNAVLKNIATIITFILFFISISSIYSGTYNPFIYFRF